MIIVRPAWMGRAACAGLDTNAWFPPQTLADQIAARTVCAGCPVQGECLRYALDHGIEHGIWGGLDPEQRRHYRQHAAAQSGAA